MTKMIKVALYLILFIAAPFIGAGYANAHISHVSINEQQFILGGYPKFRVNIVSQDASLDKMQFVVRQASGEERLMVKPINNFLLLVTGVEDVMDPSATLVVREYRVNKWRDVKVFSLFKGRHLSQELAAKSSAAHLNIESRASEAPSSMYKIASMSQSSTQLSSGRGNKPAQYRHSLYDKSCTLKHTPAMTLWRIGTEHGKAWGLSTYGAMLAIFEANTKAFNQGDINGLRADALLRCPSQTLRAKYSNHKMAKQTFEAL
ncbi:LysM peptidoglycan-binding domain-containing protein [Shewanella violacea]|uniref:Uncharacterized protein n=1 Tax=Shewanella violacea (strain JCM 10179 / CIP 106290 / LMG 19151 / DSS12) TaxID=637905 RepID=D4ZEL9_SHEVD|nr:hypothetical protein [Shewanella violacea]BAJ00249.1 hypothetical protein SVI_0278 [Shewanella violacea DSS12]